MRIRWHGQSAYTLEGGGRVVVIDPFDVAAVSGRVPFHYPPIEPGPADLLLITHEHGDHNWDAAVTGDPAVIRSTAGRIETPVGEVVAVASEHDGAAGTARGPNTIFVFTLDGVRVCHMGDFGQPRLRPEQIEAIGPIDLLMVPVGAGPTLDGAGAAEAVGVLAPGWVVPMHYRTPAIGFLEPADDFLGRFDDVRALEASEVEVAAAERPERPVVLHLAAPGGG
jgi:L-ascorbate metabolism protein UlaG (beta-lactamase superfamily)